MRTSYWLRQPTWVINPSTGDDEATGVDAGHPIRSHAELARRWSMQAGPAKLDQATTVTYTGALLGSDIVSFNVGFGEAGGLNVFGTPTSPASGAFTGVTAINRGTQTFQAVTDSGLVGGFTPYVGTHMLRIVGGPRAGSTAWVAKDLGGGSARTSRWVKYSLTTLAPTSAGMAPQVGDAYQVLLPTQVTMGDVRVQAYDDTVFATSTKIINLIDMFGHAAVQNTQLLGGGMGFIKTANCRFDALRIGGVLAVLHGCNIFGVTPDQGFRVLGGAFVFTYAALSQRGGFIAPGGFLEYDLDSLLQGAAFVNVQGHLQIGTMACFDGISGGGIFVSGPSGKAQSTADQDGADLLWGTNNIGRGIVLTSGANFSYTTKPTINSGLGLGREISVGGVDLLLADVPVSDIQSLSVIAQRL